LTARLLLTRDPEAELVDPLVIRDGFAEATTFGAEYLNQNLH
jgi:hypothetical protein